MYAQYTFSKRLAWLFSGLFLLLMLIAPVVPTASAQVRKSQLCQGADLSLNGSGDCQVNGKSAESKADQLIADVVNFISVVVGILAVIMIIYGGFRYITSAGNPENTKTARNIILYALIGLVIVALAQIIVKFVLSKIT